MNIEIRDNTDNVCLRGDVEKIKSDNILESNAGQDFYPDIQNETDDLAEQTGLNSAAQNQSEIFSEFTVPQPLFLLV